MTSLQVAISDDVKRATSKDCAMCAVEELSIRNHLKRLNEYMEWMWFYKHWWESTQCCQKKRTNRLKENGFDALNFAAHWIFFIVIKTWTRWIRFTIDAWLVLTSTQWTFFGKQMRHIILLESRFVFVLWTCRIKRNFNRLDMDFMLFQTVHMARVPFSIIKSWARILMALISKTERSQRL